MISRMILTIRMDYCQLTVSSGATFPEQMAKTVKTPMLEVESSEYEAVTRGYQKAMEAQVVKIAAKGEADRTVRAQEKGGGTAAGKN